MSNAPTNFRDLRAATRADMHAAAAANAAAVSSLHPQQPHYAMAPPADHVPPQAVSLQQHTGHPPPPAAEPRVSAPVLTGVEGMEIINEMLQRQARRLENQFSDQTTNRNSLEVLQSQLQIVQAQVQWQATRSQETATQATQSSESVARMQHFMGNMEVDRARALQTAQRLARAVNALRAQLETSDPQKFAELIPHLSDITMGGCNLASLEGVGSLFAAAAAAAANGGGPAGAGSNTRLQQQQQQDDGSSASGSTGHGSSIARHKMSSNGSDQQDTSSSNEVNADNSSSDSADAASAASTWPKVAARRSHPPGAGASRGGGGNMMMTHQLRMAVGPHGHATTGTLDAERNSSGSSSTNREGSPPEGSPPNDSNADSNGGGDSHSNGSEGKGEGGDGSPPLDPIAAQGSLPPSVPPGLRQGVVDTAQAQGVLPLGAGMAGSDGSGGQGHLNTITQGYLSANAGVAGVGNLPIPGHTSKFGRVPAAQLRQGPLGADAPPAMIQGVLPFPGQGVLDLQQGVIDHTARSLESFNYLPKGQGAASGAQAVPAVSVESASDLPAKRAAAGVSTEPAMGGASAASAQEAKRARAGHTESVVNAMDTTQ